MAHVDFTCKMLEGMFMDQCVCVCVCVFVCPCLCELLGLDMCYITLMMISHADGNEFLCMC